MGAGAAVGYKLLFDRPGELAISYIPADAEVVLTLDLTPSPEQVGTFDAIGDALRREGLLDELEQGIALLAAQNKVVAELRPHVHKSFAAAVWGVQQGRDPEGFAILLSIDDPGAVSGALNKHLRAYQLQGVRAYVIDKNATAAVIDEYLAVTNNEATMRELIAVSSGNAASVADLAEYRQARAALPHDANVMLFVSSSLLQEAGKEAARELDGANPLAGAGWFAAGLTVRQTGLLCTCRSPFDSQAVHEVAPLAEVPALALRTLDLMPSGAFGVASLSEPAAVYDVVKAFALRKPESKQELENGLADFRRESGFDLERDVLPAFRGEVAVALYPGSPEPDLLFVLENSNGATPAAFAAKFRSALASGRFDKEKPAPEVLTAEHQGITIYWVDLRDEPAGKTPGYAVVDGSVVAATSTALIREAIDAARSQLVPLSADPRYGQMLGRRLDGAKVALMVDLPAIMEEMARQGQAPPMDWRSVFADEGLAFSADYDGRTATAELFFPLDWVQAIQRLGEEVRKSSADTGGGRDAAW
jgi:hypothetical protein